MIVVIKRIGCIYHYQRLVGWNRYKIARQFSDVSLALRPKKLKSTGSDLQDFSDSKHIRAIGGKGGDGCISFLQLWCNDRAGPDGGDGGSGGHVIFEASTDVKNFNHIASILKGCDGEKGYTKNCHGKNANHTIIKVPIGTVVKKSSGAIAADLAKERIMFVAARGGCGGKGNNFFASDTTQTPQICEYGAEGEDIKYQLELKCMAHIGFIGLPNAGKSTLLRAISRAKPKVAPYAFTTLRPHIGMIQYEDYEQVAVADLPGIIADSHKNKGLGIQFLKHVERCAALMIIIDMACVEPWKHYETLIFEMEKFSPKLIERPKIIVANKIDIPEARDNILEFRKIIDEPIIEISAKLGTNLSILLQNIRKIYDDCLKEEKKICSSIVI